MQTSSVLLAVLLLVRFIVPVLRYILGLPAVGSDIRAKDD